MKALERDISAKLPAARAERELTLVPQVPPGQRARQLLLEARAASLEHLKALQAALAESQALAQAVVDGGDLYAPGLHDFAGRLAEDLLARQRMLEALTGRQRSAAQGHQEGGRS